MEERDTGARPEKEPEGKIFSEPDTHAGGGTG